MTRSRAIRCCWVPAIALATAWLGGCEAPLLTPDEPRSQYDRLDMVRGRRQPTYFYDEFNTRRPNIRGRLLNPE